MDRHGADLTNVIKDMAEGVETNDVVLCVMSHEYFLSENCQSEVLFGRDKKKHLVPLVGQSDYRAEGWLGIVMAGKKWFDLSVESKFSTEMTSLHKSIQAYARTLKSKASLDVRRNSSQDLGKLSATTYTFDVSDSMPNGLQIGRYNEIRVIGRDNYGTIHLVKDPQTGRKLAMKKIPVAALSSTNRNEAASNIELLTKLTHPNVVEYVTSFLDAEVLHIVTAFCVGDYLSQIIQRRHAAKAYFDEGVVLDIFVQLAMAVDYCHSVQILHQDLKASNVIITRRNVVKLCNVGIVGVLSHESYQQIQNSFSFYMAPEVYENQPYNSKSDVWAMGCILYELCTFKHPFEASNILRLVENIVGEEPAAIGELYSHELSSLVAQTLTKDPKQRPQVKLIFKLPFIRERLEALAKSGRLPDLHRGNQNESSTAKAASRDYRKSGSIDPKSGNKLSSNEESKLRLDRVRRQSRSKSYEEHEKGFASSGILTMAPLEIDDVQHVPKNVA
jgi:serine/threonine protein kinase